MIFDNLVLRVEVLRDLKFWDIFRVFFFKFFRVIWFFVILLVIVCNCSNKNKCEEICGKIVKKKKVGVFIYDFRIIKSCSVNNVLLK